jgi:hypothetical protein
MQLIKFVAALIIAALVTLFSFQIINFTVFTWKLDWFASYLLPIALLLGVTMLCCNIIWKALEKKFWVKLVVVLGIALMMALPYFILNPIYLQDIQKRGEHISPNQFTDNVTLQEVINENPDFDGLLAIANVDCDQCKASMINLRELIARNEKLDIVVYVYTLKQDKLNSFIEETNSHALEFHLSPDEESLIKLCDGAFPSFFYIRNGNIVQKWYSDQFGYRALSWIDSGLKD